VASGRARRGFLTEGNVLRRVRDRIRRRVERGVRVLYYGYVYGSRAVPRFLASSAARWELARPRGDTPQTAQSWDDEYRRGRWACLRAPAERARYSVIVGLIASTPSPSVLDVGCGEGVLYQQFRPYGYSRYVGLDLSHEAIDRAAAGAGPDTTFLEADADTYQAQGPYDVIVFNEMLYYLPEPVQAVRRYARALAPGGRMIVSTWMGSPRAIAILRQLGEAFAVVEETMVVHRGNQWKLTVLALSEK
jgi:2-polyprenyl-3-methyl-5-hydroxy-6-metoxy-1,4-benzoquinol methylase